MTDQYHWWQKGVKFTRMGVEVPAVRLDANLNDRIGKLDHFWRGTGFSPATLLLQADMRQALTCVASVPHRGITYVRVHYLLDLVRAEGLGTDSPTYDWSALDAGLDILVERNLKPFFELMGNPGGYFTNYEDQTQSHAWRRLVKDLATHCIERYGLDEVRSWYFETWNEPDIGFWKQSARSFCIYYDACSEGLRVVDEGLRLGGPGTSRTLSDMFKTFLAHCDRGVNYFTGETGIRLDFISVHEKGARNCPEDITPDSLGITIRERSAVEYVRANHRRLMNLPFMNDECDPQVGWWDIHTWHGRPYYAAIAAKIINQHLIVLVDELGCNYALLSNDNGFLGRWGNRSLLARFGEIADSRAQIGHMTRESDLAEDPARRRFEMIKKPIFNLMVMLSLLGDERCAVAGAGDAAADVGIIATVRGAEQVAVLVYHSRDRITASGEEPIELHLNGIPFERGVLAHYRIDEQHGDPFRVWEAMGVPEKPMAEQFDAMRAAQELALLEEPREATFENGNLALTFDLPLPSVSLILLSAKPADPPGKVQGIRAERYEGLTDQEKVLLSWQGVGSRVIRTYEVLRADSPGSSFRRVNAPDLLCTAYLYSAPSVRGIYRIRAVDYWGRAGEASDPITVV